MEKKYTETELTKYDKEVLISIFLSMQQLTESLSQTCAAQKIQLEQVNQNMKLILEQLSISKHKQFGSSSEKMVYDGQLEMCFNEAEVAIANKFVVEPELEEVCPKPYKRNDRLLAQWAVDVEERDIASTYGTTHVILFGKASNPPLVLFHGVGDDSALMWIYNAKELAKHFYIYAIDTIGGPGKSCPNENYNRDFDEIKWLDELFDGLGLERFYVAGVSNGSYMTQHYGIMRPEKVIKMVCMSGSISVKEGGSPLKAMMKVFLPEALFPTEKNTIKLIKKMAGNNSCAFTENPAIMEHFTWLFRGFNNMSMAYHKILYFNEVQLDTIRDKVLFLIGESDPLVDVEKTKTNLEHYHMNYQFFPGVGHGINHEISEEMNKTIIRYFSGHMEYIQTEKASIFT